MKVHEALSAVSAAVGAVRKEQKNNHDGYNFRGIDDVVNACHPALTDHGVTVHPVLRSVDYAVVQTSNGRAQNCARVLVDYVFTGPEGDTLTVTVPGESWDRGDKATPKAMSVALRTALLQALMLPTDSPDPDADSHEGVARPQPNQDMVAAQARVKDAFMARHGLTSWDRTALDAMVADYEQTVGQPIADAGPADLHRYADHLEGETNGNA